MIRGLFGTGTIYQQLRTGLGQDMNAARTVFDRVANATNGDPVAATQGEFQGVNPADGSEEVNLEAEIVALVDTTIRYDAETRLLREAYTRLRTAIGSNG